ncbi:MAG: putative transporter [Prevotellaceae bacterium]|jgi:putative transport protein|nr:putative transporter [Prevotellaceae bacterium]
MYWISGFLWNNSVAHTVLLLAFVIASGVVLGKIRICGISLGMAMILFVGIAVSHFGFTVEPFILHFVKEFGLILFVYAIGLQVGPGFLSSFRKGGIRLNLLAANTVALGVIATLTIYCISDIPIHTMVGILSGAVTNTPGLGAAQEAYSSVNGTAADPSIALGYAVAYPLGVVGIIFSIILIRFVFRISLERESERLEAENSNKRDLASTLSIEVKNPALFGRSIQSVINLIDRKLVISRIMYNDGNIETVSSETVLNEGNRVFVITRPQDMEAISVFIGKRVDMSMDDWTKPVSELLSRRILVTRAEINGKSLANINLRNRFGVTVTRVNRSGIDLVAHPELKLQFGDRLTVVGSKMAISDTEKILGNKLKRLNEPNIVPLFTGIFLGVLFGSIPFAFPGMPQPVKLGLAGGPLIVAILMSVFGAKFKLVTYTTMSANLMIREIGICLFLACVGLGAGEKFVDTIVYGGGLRWIGIGVIITVAPLIITGIIARRFMHIDYFTLMGLLAGSTTDPPALSYASMTAGNDAPSVSYATVYPLTMFLRVISAQLLILIFA